MSCAYPFYSDDIVDLYGNKIPIPCGRCFSCRLDIQQMYCDRMFCEYHSHPVSAFVTFTYDDKHLRYKNGFLEPTLSKDDLHKYLDKIRHQIKSPFAYYACGEYGDKFNRPHYHVIFFGLDYQLHKSFFESSWKLGMVKVLPCSSSAFRYVAKYITKGFSADFNDRMYYDRGLIPPFHKMSRGLGLSVYKAHIDEIRERGYFVFKSRRISVNRYYFNKLILRDENLILSREKYLEFNQMRLADEATKYDILPSTYDRMCRERREEALKSKLLRKNSSLM